MSGKSNTKVLWYILFAMVTVILCYMFIVVYFYYISPYNISLKTELWPFNSTHSLGEIYEDAMVEISFEVEDELDYVENYVIGVNLRKDGFIVAPYDEFRGINKETQITVKTNSGKLYAGNLLFGEPNYGVCLLKCECLNGENEAINLPYAKIKTLKYNDGVIKSVAVSSPFENKNILSGEVSQKSFIGVYSDIEIDQYFGVDYVIENCPKMTISNKDEFDDGAVFDKKGALIGFGMGVTSGDCIVMPVDCLNMFFDEVVESYFDSQQYSNPLVESFVGFDLLELECHMETSSRDISENGIKGNVESFWFNGQWNKYNENPAVMNFYRNDVEGFFVFEPVVYNDVEIIPANVRCDKIVFTNVHTTIYSKTDLFDNLYKLKTGNAVKIEYTPMDTAGSTSQSVIFNV